MTKTPNIRKRHTKDGVRYQARYYDPHGRRRSKTFRRMTDARTFLRDVEADVQRGGYIDPAKAETKLHEFAEAWLTVKRGVVRPKTADEYASMLRRYVLPALGHLRVGRLRPLDIERLMADLLRQGTSRTTVRNVVVKVLTPVLRLAVRNKAITENPCDHVELPKAPATEEMLFLTAAQVHALAATVEPHYRTLIFCAAYTGLRYGELAGLRVRHLDLLRGRIHVVEALHHTRRGGISFGPPKTPSARRSVALPAFLRDMLTPHHTAPEDLVFTTVRGYPIRHSNFYGRVFKPAVRRALPPDLHGLRFHDLRHTCASLLIAQGAHPKAIQERLGHASITTTLDRYGHLMPTLDERLTAGLDATYRDATETAGAVVALHGS